MLHVAYGTSAKQKGFTLIEMSIVLVIIGLIIGGILKGQEIIDSSRQKNLITQVDGLRSAINTFNDRYSGLPGDFAQGTTRIAAGAVNGNGNGIPGANNANLAGLNGDDGVGAAIAAGATAAAAADENSGFWCQLAIAGLVGNSNSSCAVVPTFFGNGSILPSTGYPGTGMTVSYGLHDTATTSFPRVSLWARVHRNAGSAMTVAGVGGLSAKALAAIDAKFDDGVPGLGTMRSSGQGTGCPVATAASVWDAVSEVNDCIPYFDLVQ
jgi:prepilin-type N-terminal cleavage/methylation domain-containing protein